MVVQARDTASTDRSSGVMAAPPSLQHRCCCCRLGAAFPTRVTSWEGPSLFCFVLLGVTIYCLEPAVFLPRGAAWKPERPQVCPVLAGKDGRPMMEQAKSFPGRNPWKVVNSYFIKGFLN